jgi:N-acetylglutamate synthase-like GNAT family acetyltransferase
MVIKIRDAGRDEVNLLNTLIRESFRDVAERFGLTLENCPNHPSFSTEERVNSWLDKGVRFFIAECESEPCGCVAVERADREVCYLERLAVLPPYRRRGYGEALVRHVMGVAEDMGASRLEIGIISDQDELWQWYAGVGFAEKGRARFEQLPFEVTFMFADL